MHRSQKLQIAIGTLAAVIVATFAVKKIADFTARADTNRPCDYVYPSNGTKSTTLELTQAPTDLDITETNGRINDASCLNKTSIAGIVKVHTEEDVRTALRYASDNKLKVSLAGARHSMGGHAFVQDGLVLDMNEFDAVTIDAANKQMTVQSGASWETIQRLLDEQGLAVNVMQSYNVFTVGGTLSVNAHGAAFDQGPIGATVQSVRVMLPNGEIKTASRTENEELFRHVIGGYGLFGVILDATIGVVDNALYQRKTVTMDYKEFPAFFKEQVRGNSDIALFFARLSIAPHNYLTETLAYAYTKVPYTPEEVPPLATTPNNFNDAAVRFVINASKTGPLGRWFRWTTEKYVLPHFSSCVQSRNTVMTQPEACYVVRNQQMATSVRTLESRMSDTNILQEYFVSPDNMVPFVDQLREIVRDNGANLLNVTVRVVPKDNDSALPYAKQNMLAFVLYFNQRFTDHDSQILERTTQQLIDATTHLGGTFYLPYQLHYSPEQLRAAYPEIDDFFATKRTYDPQELLVNTFYKKYAPSQIDE